MEKSTLTEDKAEKTPAGGVLVGKREGQTIIHNKGSLSGYLVGRTHAEGGIKAVNKSTGQPLEVQGGEVVITAPAVSDQTKREFEGKMMTNREILSAINEKGGGVAFAKGGDIPKNIKRTGASYKYGGKTMTDHEIFKYITGGHLAEGYSLREIASIHQVPLSELKEQVRMGMKAESEHTPSKREQMQIVKDHLFENSKYYTLLKKAGLEDGGDLISVNVVESKNQKNSFGNNLPLGDKRFDIKSNNKIVGHIVVGSRWYNEKSTKPDYYEVVKSFVKDQNKGIGTKAYIKLIAILDKPLHSDMARTPQAESVWKKLEKLNLAKKSKDDIVYESFANGGQNESLVKDAKSGKTPARDLNNYNDVLDIDADGMVGAETSLYADGGLIAPNGKTSNLTPEQYKLVRTPEFKEWFGDWENDPENASKVVDENGEPLVVYHGTYVENPFYIFDFDKADLGFHFGTYEQAKNRSETKLFFKGRKSIVNSFFLNIKTIFESTDIGEWEYPQRYIDMFVSDGLISESDAKKNGFYRLVQREENKQIREYLLNKYGKFGGFVYNNKYEGKGNSFIVLNPNQIKLADGSNTTFDGNNPDIRYADGGLIAPNGKTSNLTPEQYKLVRTPEFKAWFGDWENDPENASKVVDENGEPMVVYHTTSAEFNIFSKKKSKEGFFFAPQKERLSVYNKSNINSYFLNLRNPSHEMFKSDLNYLIPKGYDGIMDYGHAKHLGNKNLYEIIAFEPEQIKLADGTNTKFDTMNPDIRYADGGDVKPYDANMEGDSADMMFAEGGAVSPVVDNWNEVPSIWKNTSKVKKVAFTNSPYDKGLYSIVAPFLGNDDLRPIMSGINFDENGITVTDAHKLISLPYPSKEFEGIYEADLSKRVNPEQITISGKYPNYAPIIPESKNTVKYEVDVYKLLQYTNVALKYANKTTFAVNYKIYDEVMGFNGKFLIEALTTLLKLGHDKVYGHFVGYTKAFVFSPNKNYELGNDDLILIMPVMVTGEKYLGAEDMLYGNNRKLSVYYDFNDNEIHNADGSIAEFKMTYASNSVINPDDVNLLQKLANGRNKLPILDYVLVENGVARASDLDSEYYLKGVDLPNGIYKTNKGALEITMEAMDDYPRNPIFVSDEDTLEFTINSDVFEYYVDKFQNVVGKDELRPVMQGICLHHTSDNKLFLAGTDANILLKVNITEYVDMPEVFKDMKFIIQPKRLYDFLNSTEHTTLRIKCNLVATTIESDSWSFYARNIDGNFPNYEAVIPREATKLVSVGIDPIKKAFNSEPIKTYIKETDKKLDIIIFNKEDEIFIAKSEGRYGANPFEVIDVEKLCETNVDFTLEDYYNENKNVLLIMPYGYDKQTNFAFRKDLVDRVFKVVNSNKLDLHYTEMNRAYLIPIDTFDFKATTKEHKVREQKPSAEEIKLVSTINEINEIKEVIESLEILLENANRKDKKEIKETIEGLQILLDTYEY